MAERFEYCNNCYCAKLTITVTGELPKVLICKFPPLIVEIAGVEEFTHDMKMPIEKTFEENIMKVELVRGFWHYNFPTPQNRVGCPLPGTYPVLPADDAAQSDVEAGRITDMYWKGKNLYCYFDLQGAYFNNVGECTYKVFLGDYSYRFSDSRGVIYERRLKERENLDYTVECDACCKDTELLCDSHRFPGYECKPIPPINRKLEVNRYDLSRIHK